MPRLGRQLKLCNGSAWQPRTAAIGPTLPTWALQQVVGYLRYTGHDANLTAKAARDPQATSCQP
jgi:hypothetical protein